MPIEYRFQAGCSCSFCVTHCYRNGLAQFVRKGRRFLTKYSLLHCREHLADIMLYGFLYEYIGQSLKVMFEARVCLRSRLLLNQQRQQRFVGATYSCNICCLFCTVNELPEQVCVFSHSASGYGFFNTF